MCYKDWDGRSNSWTDCGSSEPNDFIVYLLIVIVVYVLVMLVYTYIKEVIENYKLEKEHRLKVEKNNLDKNKQKYKNVCRCDVGDAYQKADNLHSVKGSYLIREGYIVAKRCFVHSSWRSFDGDMYKPDNNE